MPNTHTHVTTSAKKAQPRAKDVCAGASCCSRSVDENTSAMEKRREKATPASDSACQRGESSKEDAEGVQRQRANV